MPEKEPTEQYRQHFDSGLRNHLFNNLGKYTLGFLAVGGASAAVYFGIGSDNSERAVTDGTKAGLSLSEIETAIQDRRARESVWLAEETVDMSKLLYGGEDEVVVETAEVTAKGCVSPYSGNTTPARTVPVLLLRSERTSSDGSFKYIFPTEEHRKVLEAQRQKYFVSLQVNAGDKRPPKKLELEDRRSIASRLSDELCISLDSRPETPRITAQRTVVAEQAGPADSGEDDGSKVLLYAVLAGVSLAVAKVKKWI